MGHDVAAMTPRRSPWGPGAGILALLLGVLSLAAPAAGEHPALGGTWILNTEQSEDPDEAIEDAVRDAGGRLRKRRDPPHEPSPADQTDKPDPEILYDTLISDAKLHIRRDGDEFRFSYGDELQRTFYSDRRGRTVTATGPADGVGKDYSFAYWEDDTLVVESRPRDGGRITERYRLLPETGQLHVELELWPINFPVPVKMQRIYDPASAAVPGGDHASRAR